MQIAASNTLKLANQSITGRKVLTYPDMLFLEILMDIHNQSLRQNSVLHICRHFDMDLVRIHLPLKNKPSIICMLSSASCYRCACHRLRIHSAIASWIHSYFDNVMTKFMINNRTDACKTEINLLNLALPQVF